MRGWVKSYCCYTAVTLLLLCLSSCGPAAKLRRAEKLIAKAEELGAKWRVDSVQVEVPVPIESVRVDTFKVIEPGDSIVIEKDRLKVVIKRLAGDTVTVAADCKADTIKVMVTKTITKTIKATGKIRWYHLVYAFLIGAVVGFFIRVFLRAV